MLSSNSFVSTPLRERQVSKPVVRFVVDSTPHNQSKAVRLPVSGHDDRKINRTQIRARDQSFGAPECDCHVPVYGIYACRRDDEAWRIWLIYKRCGYCGKRIEEGKTCQCMQRRKMRNDKRNDGARKLYETSRWRQCRRMCLSRYSHIDLYALFHDRKVLHADTVHHIETALEAPELFFDIDNHIPVSETSHRLIHDRYRKENEADVKAELKSYLQRYKEVGAGKIV